jgi:hypothetical protein
MKTHHQLCFVEVAHHPLSLHSLYSLACKQTCYSLTSLVNKIIHNFTNFSEMVGKVTDCPCVFIVYAIRSFSGLLIDGR